MTADQIYADLRDRLFRASNRTFVWLFLAQWAFAIAIAAVREPWAWHGANRAIHPHVYMAIGIGGLLASLPILLIQARPVWWGTRHLIAVAQMLWSALLIMLLGGRIEAHFSVFGSLAFLAFYRDPWMLATATVTVVLDHLVRGLFWPDSIYGLDNPEWWRFLEHAAWVAFETTVLVVICVHARREMRDAAVHEAALQQTAATIQHKVENRTRQLRENVERYRMLVENTAAIPFEYDAAERRVLYVAPQIARLLDCEVAELLTPGVVAAHPADRADVLDAIDAFVRGERSPSDPVDHRMLTKHGRVIHMRTFYSSRTGTRVRGIMLDVTRQTLLEAELRQAQKLESVGRLAAGVAHEINTPIQFVNDSVEFARSAIQDLLALVEAQGAALDAAGAGAWTAQLARQVAEAGEHADVPYLAEQLPRALERALDGTKRVATIVQSMKVFSYNRREITDVDLTELVQSVVTLAHSEYRYVAEVELELAPVPHVACCASEINQVVLNVLVNAAHAIAERPGTTHTPGRITIAMRQASDDVIISITDTGPGISDHAREHIFEQFYTTKPVGKGTGQGLSLSRSMVDRHHGALTFETEVGVGTTFHIRLPIQQPPNERQQAA